MPISLLQGLRFVPPLRGGDLSAVCKISPIVPVSTSLAATRSGAFRRASRLTGRGATRADDRMSEAAMEDRKKQGYF